MIEIGCSTLGFRFDSLDTALTEIQAQGFRRLDVVMVPSYCPHFDVLGSSENEQVELQEKLSSMGFALSTLNTGDGRLGDPARRQGAIDHARASLRLGQKLGVYAITIQSGVETPPHAWLDVARGVAADIRELAVEAESLGLDLTVELHKEALMATGQQALDLMELIDHPAAGVALDPSHATHAGENPADVARRLGDLVRHVHLRDAVGTNILVVPGDGEVDFPGFARALSEIGYGRVAAIELEYEHATAGTVRDDLARARPVIDEAFVDA
ncbi:MAG: xylose isomerase [Thermomicrobiales bacterium]|jgi:sugar phosphate isomerase/epimerase|nr:xylose isomerase [Thermomicrobiales bacterium]MDF3038751.1 xylose isomerase [Thermomicrobiales bacterium]